MINRQEHVFCRYEGKDLVFSIPPVASASCAAASLPVTPVSSSLPEEESRIPVTGIAAKAFLSCKTIQKLEIPDSVVWIGDWAFAHMKNLEELVLPFSGVAYGKKVFLDCGRLKKITVRGSTAGNEGLPYFLASVATVMDTTAEKYALWEPERAADARTHREWMEQYDRALAEYLEAPDEEGFEPVFIGWFHVEDMDEQIPKYVEKRQKEKIGLVLQRLRYPEYLAEDGKAYLQGYLAAHMSESGSGGSISLSWENGSYADAGRQVQTGSVVAEVICDREGEYCHQVCYLKILKESGCLKGQNIGLLLEGLKGAEPEMTAYLLDCMREERAGEDFFTGLEL